MVQEKTLLLGLLHQYFQEIDVTFGTVNMPMWHPKKLEGSLRCSEYH